MCPGCWVGLLESAPHGREGIGRSYWPETKLGVLVALYCINILPSYVQGPVNVKTKLIQNLSRIAVRG